MSDNRFKKSIDNIKEISNFKDSNKIQSNSLDEPVPKNKALKEILNPDKKDNGMPQTLYLSKKVVTQLNKLSKQSRQSKSAIVSKILEKILFEE